MAELWHLMAEHPDPNLQGFVSVLWAREQPAGISFSIRSQQTAHVWFIGYDQAFARYSPGLILLLQLAESFANDGVHTIHLGRGQERFKTSLASGQIDVAEGCIGANWLQHTWLKAWHIAKLCIKNSPANSFLRRLRACFLPRITPTTE